MSIKLTDKFQGKETVYTLEFTKNSIRSMERAGFNIFDYEKKPVTTIEQLFQGSFIANHPQVKNERRLEIFSRVGKKSELIGKLYEMYIDQIAALSDDSEEEGNSTWEEG